MRMQVMDNGVLVRLVLLVLEHRMVGRLVESGRRGFHEIVSACGGLLDGRLHDFGRSGNGGGSRWRCRSVGRPCDGGGR